MLLNIQRTEDSVPPNTASTVPWSPGHQSELGRALTGRPSWSEQVPEELCSNPTGHWPVTAEHHVSRKG